MPSQHDSMVAVLKSTVISELRTRGFKGSYPHFRRFVENRVDLFSFQHDKWGGGFVIEIARSPAEGVTTNWGKVIAADKVTAFDLDPKERKRVQPGEGSGTDSWFRYDRGQFRRCAKQVLELLPVAEAWWSEPAPGAN
jgi:hypothetical protein